MNKPTCLRASHRQALKPYTPARSAGGLPSRSKSPPHDQIFAISESIAKLV